MIINVTEALKTHQLRQHYTLSPQETPTKFPNRIHTRRSIFIHLYPLNYQRNPARQNTSTLPTPNISRSQGAWSPLRAVPPALPLQLLQDSGPPSFRISLVAFLKPARLVEQWGKRPIKFLYVVVAGILEAIG